MEHFARQRQLDQRRSWKIGLRSPSRLEEDGPDPPATVVNGGLVGRPWGVRVGDHTPPEWLLLLNEKGVSSTSRPVGTGRQQRHKVKVKVY